MRRAVLAGGLSVLLAGCGSLGGSAATAPPSVPAPSAPSAGSTPDARTTAALPTTATTTPEPEPVPEPTSSSAPPPPTLQSAFEQVRSGVVRFEVAHCDGDSVGTGFQITPTTVVTAAHVVDAARVVRVIGGTTSTAGTVIGYDELTDVALVETRVPLDGHEFRLAEQPPRVGDQIAAAGFALGLPLAFHTGTVNGLDRKVAVEGVGRHGLLEHDAAITQGNSGGPLILADGSVVGIAHAEIPGGPGRRWAVSATTAHPLVERWLERPDPPPVPDCTAADQGATGLPDPGRDDVQAVTTLRIYFDSINSGDFATALAQMADPGPLDEFVEGVASSHDSDVLPLSVEPTADGLAVWVTFTSRQEAGRGPAERPEETCTNWSLDYLLVQRNGLWLIDTTRAHAGTPPNAPCPAAAAPAD